MVKSFSFYYRDLQYFYEVGGSFVLSCIQFILNTAILNILYYLFKGNNSPSACSGTNMLQEY